eukprot:CAMPEP_0196599436 /NCGR_PEP_ID=MMETSP1081-20130531/94856_1 /TAXON_ID=36882 /ORGANISM="Pyramimonas amylifera, Strain CCMP720" /LENGTH=93 /DNA_ID=CAMNT_0041925207 /DNA_START=74 /DNA_END=352 /DNA_ORIENTATION=+
MTRETLSILLATEVIAVNQDPAGHQARKVWAEGPGEVWQKLMSDGRVVLLLFNSGSEAANVTTVLSRDAPLKSSALLSSQRWCVDKSEGCSAW